MAGQSAHAPPGLLIVGHGTRSERGQGEFLELVRWVERLLPHVVVEPGYLELATPDIDTALARLAARGAQQVVVLPLLLFAAGHAKDDIPTAVRAAARQHPQIVFRQAAHLGCHPRLLAASAARFFGALAGDEAISLQETLWLMVGRGSHDAGALAEMQRFMQLRQRYAAVGPSRVAYLAMAEPKLHDLLPELAELRYRRVVVQPHLLFHGELLETLAAAVAQTAARWPAQDWIVAGHLGLDEHLAAAIVERFAEAQLTWRAEVLTKT